MDEKEKRIVDQMMARVREGRLPSSDTIVAEAFKELGYRSGSPDEKAIRKEFNSRLNAVFVKTLEVLERYESQAYGTPLVEELFGIRPEGIKTALAATKGQPVSEKTLREAIRNVFVTWYPYLQRAFLSVSQSRKTRGGKDFELQFGELLRLIDVPYEKVTYGFRTDFMMPNEKTYKKNRNLCLIASAKRTLRERWREVAEELYSLRSPNVYLVTADKDVNRGHVDGICRRHNIHLVVWDEVKQDRFLKEGLVEGFTVFANSTIPHFEALWKKNGVY